jgi:hypothetical protein
MIVSFFPEGMTVTPERAVPKRNLSLPVLNRCACERRTPPAWRYVGHGWAAPVTASPDGILKRGVS